ncbi:hypothetical protein Solca_2862 [Solitalea canadensis DSM 3403]|uniref:Uncharacterized protein n=1 Tax=Solitalea canadensis (strain ATCC 29591 / DSM 3403 / JCM 21819 / LMG 8368 / NBRC 15130 / NCIMB 12057 / USAM 9D) TaxID=929556 RepID=H8KW94_SOLCM|nr:hypothetical protein Solca_2862 [Solitalea canadensis DSM 3403]
MHKCFIQFLNQTKKSSDLVKNNFRKLKPAHFKYSLTYVKTSFTRTYLQKTSIPAEVENWSMSSRLKPGDIFSDYKALDFELIAKS